MWKLLTQLFYALTEGKNKVIEQNHQHLLKFSAQHKKKSLLFVMLNG